MGEDYNIEPTGKMKNNKILAYVGLAVFLATVLFIAFFTHEKPEESIADLSGAGKTPSQNPVNSEAAQSSPGNTGIPEGHAETVDAYAAAPFIYEKNADIFMGSGKNKIKLGSRQSLYGCYKEMNCVLSEDNRYLYYIESTDINTGQGTLKSVSTDAASPPVTVEDGVCAAEISSAGSIMYIKNIDGLAGELYLLKDGKSSLISKNVLPVFLRFSKGGNCISYIVQDGSRTFTLYVKKNGKEPKLITRISAVAAVSGGISLSGFIDAVPFDTGQVLYSIEENYNTPLYFYYPDGKIESVCSDGYIIKTYPNGDFLYADIAKNNLWYKSPGTDAVNITENYSYSRFSEDTNRFLLMEHTGDGFDNSRIMLYEIGEDKKKTAISLGDDKIFEINAAFDCVAYESGGALYVSRKTDTGWKEVYLLKASGNKINTGPSKSSIVARFDGKGNNLYFFDENKCGPLYRFSLKEGKTVKLLDNVDCFYVNVKAVYAHTSNDKLYRIAGEIKMISERVRDVKETQGGAFLLLVNGTFKFIPEGSQSAQALDSFTGAAGITKSIEFRPPLVEDLSAALEVLSDEANYCLYKLGVYKVKTEAYINIHDALTMTQKLAGRKDISETERKILKYLAEGFSAYEKNEHKAAKTSFRNATDTYAEYINSAVDDNI